MIFLLSEEFERIMGLLYDNPERLFFSFFAPNIPWLSSICCFFATILTFSFLERHKEWSSLLACSVSPLWIGVSFMILSLLVVVGNLTLIYLAPAQDDFSGSDFWEPKSFQMRDEHKGIWYFQEFDPKSMSGKNLQLYLNDEEGRNYGRLRCKHAVWLPLQKLWQFREGVFWGYPTPKGVPKPNTQNKSFEWLDVSNDVFLSQAIESNTPIKKFVFQTLELEDIKVDPNPYFLVKKNPSRMSYLGINSVLNNFPTPDSWELNPYRYQKALIVINSLSCFFVTFCALVLVMGKSTPEPKKMVGMVVAGVVVFYILKTSFNKIGERGITDPWLCAAIPFLGVCVLFLVLKIRRLNFSTPN